VSRTSPANLEEHGDLWEGEEVLVMDVGPLCD
jgi:hypothetical protein